MKRAVTWLVIFLLLAGAAWLVWPQPAAPVDLTKNDGKTIDFSSGRPVVKDSAADRAAIEKAKKDMDAAVKEVSFGPPAKKTLPGNPAERGVSGTNTGSAAADNGAPPPKK